MAHHSNRKEPRLPKGFPMWVHPSGQYAKKRHQKTWYSGSVRIGWQAALERFNREWPDILAGREPRRDDIDKLTLKDAANIFMLYKKRQRDNGELTRRTFADYHRDLGDVLDALGRNTCIQSLRFKDFSKLRDALSEGISLYTLTVRLTRVRHFFKWLYDSEHLDIPLRYQRGLAAPSKANVRKARAASGNRMWSREEVHAVLEIASPQLRCAILLALNCAYRPNDLAQLQTSHIDGEWVDFPRAKTGIPRRCWLWPETREAIAGCLELRSAPHRPEWKSYVFLLPNGRTFTADNCELVPRFRTLMQRANVYAMRRGLYDFRRLHRTVADDVGDEGAAGCIMGHARSGMTGVYVQEIRAAENAITPTQGTQVRRCGGRAQTVRVLSRGGGVKSGTPRGVT